MMKFILLVFFVNLIACSNSPRYRTGTVKTSVRKSKSPAPLKTKSNVKHRKIMKGVSSFYAEDFHGKLTANGEVYDMYGLTAAHNKSLILRVNDRGPYVKGRILDCSYGAAKKLDFIVQGTTDVKIEVIEWGDNKYMKHKN
jgi:rare lipoprotein A